MDDDLIILIIIIIIIILICIGLYEYYKVPIKKIFIKVKNNIILNIKLVLIKIFKKLNINPPNILSIDKPVVIVKVTKPVIPTNPAIKDVPLGSLLHIESPSAILTNKNSFPPIILPCNGYNTPDSGCCDQNVPINYMILNGTKPETNKIYIGVNSCRNFSGLFIIKYHMEYMYNNLRIYGNVFTDTFKTNQYVIDNIKQTIFDKIFYVKVTYYNPSLVETTDENNKIILKLENDLNFWLNLHENIISIKAGLVPPTA